MNNTIKTYYIPNHPNIKKGPIYTLYLNNNTNLDLSSLLENNITLNTIINPIEENKLIKEQEYKKLTEITFSITILITDLNKLNIESQNILKNLSNERKI